MCSKVIILPEITVKKIKIELKCVLDMTFLWKK
jgi:hypothetical protein